ncbi:AI-2E family transporter [Thiolapillus sp.]
MNKHLHQNWPVNQLFILLSTVLVSLVILRYASALLVPFLVALAIAIVLSPLFKSLERRRIPRVISLVLVSAVPLTLFILLAAYISQEVSDLAANIGNMKNQLDAAMDGFARRLSGIGLSVTPGQMEHALAQVNISGLVQQLVARAGNQFSNLFLIFFTAAFILMETDYFFAKLQKIMEDRGQDMSEFIAFIDRIKAYFLLKVKTSLITGLWVLAVLWFHDIPYAVLWATLAFFLNFIPVIGSILAAIPPIVVAFLDQSLVTALWVTAWYLVINTVIGNILEPHIMGRGLGLSALVIFLSMTFWGWIFGPAGMILSVPLTMGLQFLFSRYEETRWIAFLLSDYRPAPATLASGQETNHG